jgi:hypothetical protein
MYGLAGFGSKWFFVQNMDGVLGKLLPKGLKQKIITTMTKGVSAAAKVCFDENGAERREE